MLFGTFITLECEMIVLEHCIFESKITLKKSHISIMIRHKVKEKITHVASPSTFSKYSPRLDYLCEFLDLDKYNEEKNGSMKYMSCNENHSISLPFRKHCLLQRTSTLKVAPGNCKREL
jgi:hypothetical protein